MSGKSVDCREAVVCSLEKWGQGRTMGQLKGNCPMWYLIRSPGRGASLRELAAIPWTLVIKKKLSVFLFSLVHTLGMKLVTIPQKGLEKWQPEIITMSL